MCLWLDRAINFDLNITIAKMSATSRNTSTSGLVAVAVAGIVLGAAGFALLSAQPGTSQPPNGAAQAWTACFGSTDLRALTAAPGAWGARFYIADNGSGGLSALVVPIDAKDGRHIPDASGKLQFMLFRSIQGGQATTAALDEAAAQAAVKAAAMPGREPWSVDVGAAALQGLLAVKDANGAGLLELRTTDGMWTFELVPVKLASKDAKAVGTAKDVLVAAAPCPLNCPNPANYLHRR